MMEMLKKEEQYEKQDTTIYYNAQMQQRSIQQIDNRKVIKKVGLLTFIGFLLIIFFFVLTILVYLTNTLNSQLGAQFIVWFTGFVQLFSCIAIIRLFTNVISKTMDNLRWIQTIGSRKNKINQNYQFKIPAYMIDMDPSKKFLEQRINFVNG